MSFNTSMKRSMAILGIFSNKKQNNGPALMDIINGTADSIDAR